MKSIGLTTRLSLALFLTLWMGITFGQKLTNLPGFCHKTKPCKPNEACISVLSSRTDASDASQCTPNTPPIQVCAGELAGYCPIFSNWPKRYKAISSVCAFTEPDNCRPQSDPVDDDDGKVTCFHIVFNKKPRYGIFQCVDALTYKNSPDKYSGNWTSSHLSQCKSNGTDGVCNTFGTCSPVNRNSLEKYECKCLPGYNKADNCYNVIDNQCISVAQCGSFGECVQNGNFKQCQCKEGAQGHQCRLCDPKSPAACSGKGTCSNGKCICNDGLQGDHCESFKKTVEDPSSSATLSTYTFSAIVFSLFIASFV